MPLMMYYRPGRGLLMHSSVTFLLLLFLLALFPTTPSAPVYTSTSNSSLSPIAKPTLVENLDATSESQPPPLQNNLAWLNVVAGIVFICLGLLEVFYGYKYIRITLAVMGFLFFSSLAVLIMLLSNNASGKTSSVALYFTVWLLTGLISGLLSYFCWHLGLMLTAAYGGFATSMTILALVHLNIYPLRWAITCVVMIILAIFVHFEERHVVIVTTSVGGAYTFMCGVDEFARQGFRDIIHVADLQESFQFSPNASVYVMIAFMFVLAIIGICYEYWAHEEPLDHIWIGNGHRRKRDAENNGEYTTSVYRTSILGAAEANLNGGIGASPISKEKKSSSVTSSKKMHMFRNSSSISQKLGKSEDDTGGSRVLQLEGI